MSLSEQLQEAITSSSLMESSLGRIYQHHQDRAFVILTSWRGEASLDENRRAFKDLKKQIRGDGYGFIQIEGVGQEKRGGKLVESSEPSLLVPANSKGEDDGALIKKALKWAKKPGGHSDHKQDFIFYHNGAGESAVINASSGATDFKLKEFKPNSIGQFYSKLKGGRTFKYESKAARTPQRAGQRDPLVLVALKYAEAPSGWIEGMGRESEGEVFDYCESMDDMLAEVLAEDPDS